MTDKTNRLQGSNAFHSKHKLKIRVESEVNRKQEERVQGCAWKGEQNPDSISICPDILIASKLSAVSVNNCTYLPCHVNLWPFFTPSPLAAGMSLERAREASVWECMKLNYLANSFHFSANFIKHIGSLFILGILEYHDKVMTSSIYLPAFYFV